MPKDPGSGGAGVTGRVRLRKEPGASDVGQSTVPTTGGTPRVPKSACVTACHNRAPTGFQDFRESLGAGQALPSSGAAGGRGRWLPGRLSEPWPGASPSGGLRPLEGKAGPPPAPQGLEAPPCLALGGKPDSGEGTPNPGLLMGAPGGKPGYRATPQGLRTPELPTSTAPCRLCSGPQQRQTLGSWSLKRKTGKHSDQREGVTVQKKPVQPERALHAMERRAPHPRRPHPCPGRGNTTKAGTSLAGGAVSWSTCWSPA